MANPTDSDGSRAVPAQAEQRERRPAAPRAELTSFARRTVVVLLISLLFLALALVLWRGIHVLLQAFAGVLFALFLSSLSGGLSRRTGIRYGWALTIVVIGFLALVGGTGWFLANHLAVQLTELSEKLPQSLQEIQDYLAEYRWGRLLLEQVPDDIQAALAQGDQFWRVTGILTGVVEFLEAMVVILIVGIFGAAEPDLYRAGLLHLVPPPHRPRAREAVDALVYNLHWWLLGQVVLMVVLGLTTALGLWLLGVPLALTLGLITGVLEMIPYIGAWISAVPAALVALLISPGHMLATLALFLLLHMLEGYVLLPLVQRRAVHLPPALTLVMQVLLAELLGLMGLFVAAPLTVAGVVLLKMLYVEDTLGDQSVEVPGETGKEERAAAGVGVPAG